MVRERRRPHGDLLAVGSQVAEVEGAVVERALHDLLLTDALLTDALVLCDLQQLFLHAQKFVLNHGGHALEKKKVRYNRTQINHKREKDGLAEND